MHWNAENAGGNGMCKRTLYFLISPQAPLQKYPELTNIEHVLALTELQVREYLDPREFLWKSIFYRKDLPEYLAISLQDTYRIKKDFAELISDTVVFVEM